MVEIDNKKMWESILGQQSRHVDYMYITASVIEDALRDQGLQYNKETKQIVSIEPEFNGIPIRAGRWYVCDCGIIYENQTVAFHKDETYYCPKDGWLDVKGLLFEVGSLNIFRPATEEEIPHEPYFKVGDRVRRKGTNTKGDVITNIYESGGVTMYEFENSEDAPQSLSWELVDNSQRMESAKAKEALLPDRELTEFEDLFIHIYQQKYPCELSDKDLEFCRKAANELLSIARKQIVSEIEPEQLTEKFKQYVLLKEANGCDGPLISLGTDCYKRGIKHCLDEIELKGIVRKE